jgi:hypothetical protein
MLTDESGRMIVHRGRYYAPCVCGADGGEGIERFALKVAVALALEHWFEIRDGRAMMQFTEQPSGYHAVLAQMMAQSSQQGFRDAQALRLRRATFRAH